jgi:hypothetical protein
VSKLDKLLREYGSHVAIPWQQGLAGAQRVIFIVYDKADELRFRTKVDEFEITTKTAGHNWKLLDLTNSFPEWMVGLDYRDNYFEAPEDIEGLLPQFVNSVVTSITDLLTQPDVNDKTVVAIMGIACLFGFAKVSEIVQRTAPHIRGRLVVFFPGEYENNNYRLLDARDGWNYLAVPITAHSEVLEG